MSKTYEQALADLVEEARAWLDADGLVYDPDDVPSLAALLTRIRDAATAEGIKAGMDAATAALTNNYPEPDAAVIARAIRGKGSPT